MKRCRNWVLCRKNFWCRPTTVDFDVGGELCVATLCGLQQLWWQFVQTCLPGRFSSLLVHTKFHLLKAGSKKRASHVPASLQGFHVESNVKTWRKDHTATELKWRKDQLVELYLWTMWDKLDLKTKWDRGTQSFILRFLLWALWFHGVHYLFKFAIDKECAPKLSSVFDDSKKSQTIIRSIWRICCLREPLL